MKLQRETDRGKTGSDGLNEGAKLQMQQALQARIIEWHRMAARYNLKTNFVKQQCDIS